MARMLSTQKNKRLVGLDIQAGSVAATEVSSNGHTAVSRFGTMPLPPGVVREGEVADGEQLTAVLKELFAHNKLAKSVRLGLASQRVAVRLLRLPAIDDHKELETAVRFQAQDLVPMPLDQAVLDWQVVGHDQRGRWRAPARRGGRRRAARSRSRHGLGTSRSRPPADRGRPLGLRNDSGPRERRPRARRTGHAR